MPIEKQDVLYVMQRAVINHLSPCAEITKHDIRIMALAKDIEKGLDALSSDYGSRKGLCWVKEYSQIQGADIYVCPKCMHTYSKALPKCPNCKVALSGLVE